MQKHQCHFIITSLKFYGKSYQIEKIKLRRSLVYGAAFYIGSKILQLNSMYKVEFKQGEFKMNGPLYGTFRVTQIYKGATHKGLDMAGVTSKEIHSTVDGVAEVAGWDMKAGAASVDTTYGMGQYVRIKGDTTGYEYYFAHMSKLLVTAGQRVKQGDVIGIEGSTGHSTGPHVHYEIRKTTNNTTFLDVSEISGIPNQLGIYIGEAPDPVLEEAKKKVQEKAGLNDNTMAYLEEYKYGAELLKKLAAAMS